MLFALTASESWNLNSLIGATNNDVHASATNNDVHASATNNDVHWSQ